jgi:hypothetical protein
MLWRTTNVTDADQEEQQQQHCSSISFTPITRKSGSRWLPIRADLLAVCFARDDS